MNNIERMIAGLRCCAESKNVCVADECPLFEMCQVGRVNPMAMAAEMLQAIVQQRDDTENDRDALEAKLSELLSHVTGGRFSKSTYNIADMTRFADDCRQEECEKCEELAQVKRERDAAVADIAEAAPCFSCKHFKGNGGTCGGGRRCYEKATQAEWAGRAYKGPVWEWLGVQEVAEDA